MLGGPQAPEAAADHDGEPGAEGLTLVHAGGGRRQVSGVLGPGAQQTGRRAAGGRVTPPGPTGGADGTGQWQGPATPLTDARLGPGVSQQLQSIKRGPFSNSSSTCTTGGSDLLTKGESLMKRNKSC